MDVELLSRIQFAVTIGFHFLFPPISIGLAWMLVIIEGLGWRRNDLDYVKLGKFFGKVLALTFAVGVATGIVMEFQFGTNWSRYSKVVGDVFGAPLAAEGVIAFFLESGFLGLYLFGRDRVGKGLHWFSILMVAVGSTLSAFWIIVANSWQQTPAGFVFNPVTQRAELTSFFDAVFNPSTLIRFFHTVDAALITGAFWVAGISAYWLLKNKSAALAKKSLKIAVIFGLIVAGLEVFPLGHEHGQQVATTQPEKFAAMNGIYATETGAPIMLFAVPLNRPPELIAKLQIPGLLSWLAFGDVHAEIRGINEFPREDIPPLFLTFVSYHNMVILGMFFILVMALSVFFLIKGTLWDKKRLLRVLLWSMPLPLAACQLGWMAAEVGRQPWIVYHVLRTHDAFSPTVGVGEVWFSLIAFSLLYLFLGTIYVYLLKHKMDAGPDLVEVKHV
ncbi:MAG: cytochrome ubiquinol oxidase subunit I [Calditrichaeota bacterium]|nr:cytochrome ubiquinol oxidase subunit I [Calditrichota bacterium]MCB9367188.1 cytochrome ubiquinol oxidase subunit I [Calditrichota bacterium]